MPCSQGDYLMTVKERDDAIKKLQEEEERKVFTFSIKYNALRDVICDNLS